MTIIRGGVEYVRRYLAGMDLTNVYLDGVGYLANAPGQPAAPVAAVGRGYLDWSWSAPDDNGYPITDYDLEVGTSVNGPWIEQLGSAASTSRSFRDTVPPGTTFYARVRARNQVGAGPWSPVSAGYQALVVLTVPAAPAAPTPTAGSGYIDWTWGAPADGGTPITDYDLEVGTSTAGPWVEQLGAAAVTARFFRDSVASGTTYYARVRARNAVGAGPWSAVSIGAMSTNRAPVVLGFTDRVVRSGGQVIISLASGFTDPDGDDLTYEVQYAVERYIPATTVTAEYNAGNVRVSYGGIPGAIRLSPVVLNVRATDTSGLSVVTTLRITAA